ncbi:DNA gyrase subunit A [Helicobacter valdiviensis]|uniref:DNA gyrase subunit A n=2 Tax=Helicobacter valdiviensis TaxID=1458358 RepID=A0A2W6MVJ0_9HELI|nr:DNA topoisomerase (ATP-hydrolyzing) subunit A [Helicobacter valdiviensis]PZT48437.1 DNA gyrase subunit A [Helicobacter valdiviensis]
MSDLLNQDIQNVNIEDSIKESYLDYSMSVIVGRALPDARDGLKPVHRRILYAMSKLNATAGAKHLKSARIVGDVIGKYHPHGDTAVYDALVRMAQDFSMRLELVDGQGNFGSIDGDSAAAMRYTEARMTKAAEEILRDIEKDTVDFIPNYDDTTTEPDILPSRLPNLLINGSNGIAVGMATNIPPHRSDEILDALIYLVDNKNATLDEIMQFIEGPDFPTGGIIYGKSGIREAYESGRGRIKIRAKTHIEKTKTKDIIVIDEIPYQVNKARLVEQIAELARDKVIEGISEVRDESDREGIRVVIELKREAMSEIVLNHLFKSTPMESTFGIILLAIYNKEPKIFNLLELLHLFLSHRKSIVIRRTIFDLEKAKARAHILEGLRIALENIDEIVALVRSSSDPKVAKNALMEKFNLSEIQAQAILDMRLQRLTGLERDKIENEYQELLKEIEYLSSILKSESMLNGIIKEELQESKNKFTSKRLTAIEEDYESIDMEDLIPNEPVVVTMSHRGYVKRVPVRTYEKQNRGGKGKISANTHDDDFIESFFVADTHDTIMFVTNKGQLYWLKVYRIPEASRTAIGKAVVNLINLAPDEKIMATITTKDFNEDKSIAFFTRNGIIKRTNLSEFKNIRSVGVRAINLDENDEVVTAKIITPSIQEILVVTYEGMCVRFGVSDAREIGRVARGVTAIKFKMPKDFVIGATVISSENEEILSVSEKGIGKRTEANEYRITKRGGKGVIAMKLTPKTGKLVGVVNVDENMDLMVLTSSGKMIRVDMHSIRKAGRATSGVIIVNVAEEKVVSIARCPKEEKEEEEIEEQNQDMGLLGE